MATTTIPGAQGVSEWGPRINGFIGYCVQAAESVITGIYGVLPASTTNANRLAWDQIARGEASARGGASNYTAAGAQLSRLGIANTVRDPSWVARNNPFTAINAALGRGVPVLIGVNRATNLQDSVTGARPDVGVYGHGLTVVGADLSGYLVADPNTPQGAGFMHYSASNLRASGLDSLVIPNDPPAAVQAAVNQSAAGSGYSSQGAAINFPGGGISLPGINFQAAGSSVAQGILSTIAAPVEDAGIRLLLILAGFVILVIALVAFLFAGSGRTATGEAAKAGVRGAVTAAMA